MYGHLNVKLVLMSSSCNSMFYAYFSPLTPLHDVSYTVCLDTR